MPSPPALGGPGAVSEPTPPRHQLVTCLCTGCRRVVTVAQHTPASLATNSNLLLQELTVPAGEEWQPPDAAWWFVRIVDGAAYWLGKPQPISLEKGMLLLLPGTAAGCIRSSQINPTRISYFAFIPDAIVGVFTVTDRAQVSLPAGPAATAPRAYPPDSAFAQELAGLTSGRPLSTSLIFRCQLLGFAVRVLNECEPAANPNPPTPSPAAGTAPTTDLHGVNQRLTVLVRRLADADLVRLSGEELAQQCGCSVRHFRRLFRKVMGVSLQYRQSELRMLKARQMLIESDLPVVEISKACGFHHQSLFHAMFKAWVGVTPGQWRARERASKPTVSA